MLTSGEGNHNFVSRQLGRKILLITLLACPSQITCLSRTTHINPQHTFPFDYRSEPSWLGWDPSKWAIKLLWCLGLATGLRKASDAEIRYSVKYMQSKKDNRDPVDDVGLEAWNMGEVFDYIADDKERCVLVINGYVVDATTYMATHVRYALDFFGVLYV